MDDAYIDPEGRRRIDRDGTHQPGLSPEQQLAAMTKRLMVAEGKLAQATKEIATIKRAHIEGTGHSGTIGNGMKFDPDALSAGAGGAIGVSGSFYVCAVSDSGSVTKLANFVLGQFTGFTDPP